MLTYIALCAIFVLAPCSTVPPLISSRFILPKKEPDNKFNGQSEIADILNPLNGPNDHDERDFKEQDNTLDDTRPKITIWEFPTERRVFLGNYEIFITSKEDEIYSHEAIDPLNVFLLHPHKRHGAHKDLGDEKQFPAFREKNRRIHDELIYRIVFPDNIKKGSVSDLYETYPKHNHEKRNVHEKERYIPNDITNRPRHTWKEYFKWLLGNNVNDPDMNNQDENNRDPNKGSTIKPQHDSEDDSISNVNSESTIINLDKITDSSKFSDNIQLQPVDPETVKRLLAEFKNNGKKLNINPESY